MVALTRSCISTIRYSGVVEITFRQVPKALIHDFPCWRRYLFRDVVRPASRVADYVDAEIAHGGHRIRQWNWHRIIVKRLLKAKDGNVVSGVVTFVPALMG